MAIGEKIRFVRNRQGIAQKYLGMAVGSPEIPWGIRQVALPLPGV